MKSITRQLYFLPFIIIIAYSFIYDSIVTNESRYYFALIITIAIPFLLINIFNIKPIWFVIISFPILIFSIIYNVQISDYKTFINLSTWPIILNSNPEEARDFFSMLKTTTKITILIQILTYIFYSINSKNKKNKKSSNKQKYIFTGLLVIIIIDFSFDGASRKIFPYRAISSLTEYINIKRIEKKYLEEKRNTSFNSYRNTTSKNKNETIIIVIGESLRRDHLQYYGYNKETTPLMSKEDLFVFTDVVSPANQTINSLKRIMTLAEGTNEKPYWKYPSFIKIFKEVGFKTYWITAQPSYGIHATETTYIAKETDFFIPIDNVKYDTDILNKYKEILNNNVTKKLIILHVKGNHFAYNKRYPNEFNIFTKIKNIKYKNNLINEYDNSVRFNDYFLSKVLNYLKQKKGKNSFIMFSDHGESLFATCSTCYGHGYITPTKPEFNIPLIFWFSEEYKNKYSNKITMLNNNKDKSILLSDFFHSIPTLYGINFSMYNEKNNFLGNEYIVKKNRYVMTANYDLLKYEDLKNSKYK